jgi:hypothetical protein
MFIPLYPSPMLFVQIFFEGKREKEGGGRGPGNWN